MSISNSRLSMQAVHTKPKFALMGIKGGDGQRGNYLIRASDVDTFLDLYEGYEQKNLDDWTGWDQWKERE
jgi:hypothetical protein